MPPDNTETETELERLRRLGTQAQGAVDTARQGFSLLGSLFSVAMWAGLALIVWNVMPTQWRESIANMIPQEWRDMAVSFINQTTGMFGEQALDAASRMPAERIREELTSDNGLNLPDEVAQAIAPNDTAWGEFVDIMRANEATINEPLNAGVITDIFTNHPAIATRIVGSLTAFGGAAGADAMPAQLKTALEAFIASDGFNQVMNNEDSRALLFQALVNIAPEGEDLPTVAELERIYTELQLTPDQLRSIAATALNGADLGEAMQALIADPAISARLRDNPDLRTAVAGDRADELGALLVVQDMLTKAGFTTAQMETLAAALQGDAGVAGAIAAMYEVNAEAANTLLGNAANLEQLSALVPADADASNPVIALLKTSEGRNALSTLVTDLAAGNANAPKQLLDIIAALETHPTEAQAALVAFLSEDQANLAALRNFATAIDSVDAPAGSELANLKDALAEIRGDDFNPAVAGAVLAMPEPTRQAIDDLRTVMDTGSMNAALTLLMRDETLRVNLLTQNVDANGAAIGQPDLDGVGDAIAALSAGDPDNIMLQYLAYKNDRTDNYSNLHLMYALVERMDAATGGTGGAEARADQLNADVLSIVLTMAQGGDINVDDSALFRSDYKITVPGTNRTITADEFASVFENDQVRDAFAQFFDGAASLPADSPLYSVMEALNRTFWDDRNGDGKVNDGGTIFDGDGEGLVGILMRGDAVGQLFQYWDEMKNGTFKTDGPGLGTDWRIGANAWALEAMGAALEELGNLTTPTTGRADQNGRGLATA